MYPEAIAPFCDLADRSLAEREQYCARQQVVPAALRAEVESRRCRSQSSRAGTRSAPAAALTINFSAWYSRPTLAVLVMVVGLTAWSFSVALAGRPLFEDETAQTA
jgi:hypothetical protein